MPGGMHGAGLSLWGNIARFLRGSLMFFIRPRVRMAAPPSFSAQQFSASTRSAALLLLILSVLAALSILFAPAVQGQTPSVTLNSRANSRFAPKAWDARVQNCRFVVGAGF